MHYLDISLSTDDVRALCGEMTPTEYAAHGMELFDKGLVKIDPLASGARTFPLTSNGIRIAHLLRITHIDVWFDLDQTLVWYVTFYDKDGNQVGDSENHAHKRDAKTSALAERSLINRMGRTATVSIGKRDGTY